MDTKEKYILAVISIALLLVVSYFAKASLTGYQIVEGKVVGINYSSGGVSVGVGQVDGKPANVTSIQPEKYTLIIDVNGKVSSYSVKAETYEKALSGQVIFQMKCNAFLCGVIE